MNRRRHKGFAANHRNAKHSGISDDAPNVQLGVTRSFAVTWDYRCPFARNVHEHLIKGLQAGADWNVRFSPFSLGQSHVEPGDPSVWENPEGETGLLALQAGVEVRDSFPHQFLAVHGALFAARHDQSLQIRDAAVVRTILEGAGVDADAVFAAIESGAALEKVKAEHEAGVNEHSVWGVPTFIVGDQAAFARLMKRPEADADPATSVSAIERIVDMLSEWPDLNEFKHTSLPS